MKRIPSIALVSTFLPLALACGKNPAPTPIPPTPEPEPEPITVAYNPSDENFPNPERGFYNASEVFNATGRGISDAVMRAARLQGRTLFLLEFHLTNYVATDIDEAYLQTIRANFESLRKGGVKCILRFCYSNSDSAAAKPWDATPEQVHKHIDQLTPLIQ
ncbi:MAG: DUF4874 domain-containing protein, partial [Bacteroidales bacterium]|nr:DUF4874 domain-containing protein [Bacteroidales bacterium]